MAKYFERSRQKGKLAELWAKAEVQMEPGQGQVGGRWGQVFPP